jgi:hypothetical protein
MALLRNRNLALLFTGQGVARLGDGLDVAVVASLAWSLTRAARAVTVSEDRRQRPDVRHTLIGACTRTGAPFAPARDALVARVAPAESLVKVSGLLQVSFRAALLESSGAFAISGGLFMLSV